MSIITISRGSYSKGKDVAQKVAEKLGYQCIARDILIETSKEFNTPEFKLIRAIHDSPSILEKFTHGKEKYIAYFQAALLKHLQKDNIVYHGLAGHFFVKGVSHALKIRIIADMDDRVRLEMAREKVSKEEALRVLKNDDEERRKWSFNLYGIDTSDVTLYDLIIHIRDITVDDAVDIICEAVRLNRFKTTFESQKIMDNLTLAAEAKAALVHIDLDVNVRAEDGHVYVESRAPLTEETDLEDEMKKIVSAIPGAKWVHIKTIPRVKWSDGRLFP